MTKSSLKINIGCLKMVQMTCNLGTLCNMKFLSISKIWSVKHLPAHIRPKEWLKTKHQIPMLEIFVVSTPRYKIIPKIRPIGPFPCKFMNHPFKMMKRKSSQKIEKWLVFSNSIIIFWPIFSKSLN